MQNIRNFSIVAHVDHGKSTLADRLIQRAKLVPDREFRDQILDSMDLERERGITIKSQAVTLPYTAQDGREYRLNLIDTPGHVDFCYEVSRALCACEGVVLLVDASQGVEAQTVAHLYSALEQNLEILPAINKIDLPSADVERAREQIASELGLNPDDAVLVSAKEGRGIDELLEAIVRTVPAPRGDPAAPLRALIFDAHYDAYRGAVASIRVFDGTLRPGDVIRLMAMGTTHKVEEVGLFKIRREPVQELQAGHVGYVIAGIRSVRDTRVGDTITLDAEPADAPLEGFREVKPVVFSSLYPVQANDYLSLATALDKLRLNDAALVFQKDTSAALGQGFRCGFLGLLHLDIVQERLEREFSQSLIITTPSVQYRFTLKDGSLVEVDNPVHFPDPSSIQTSEEPYIKAQILLPDRYIGAVMQLCRDRRAATPELRYPAPGRVELTCEMPLAEAIYDFYDKLKSVTQGYGSFDYELVGYRVSDLVKLDILVNGERVDALSVMLHRANARPRAVRICERLRDEIPRHLFKIAVQGAIGGQIIARSTISPFRKDVTAKCYGGDVTRKRKLLEKQKEGKRRMKQVGEVEIPQSAFIAVLKSDDD